MRRFLLLTVVTAGVASVVAGCGGTTSGTASPAPGGGSATPNATSPAVPKFDACAVIPTDVLASMGLPTAASHDPDTGACRWMGSDTDVVGAEVADYQLGQRPDPFDDTPTNTPLTIGAHKAMVFESASAGVCGVDLALASDITYDIWVTAQDSKTYPAACGHAKALATGVEPKLPVTS